MDSDPISCDFRAIGHQRRRFLDRQHKYHAFKHVSPGALDHPHYDLHRPTAKHRSSFGVPLPHTCAVTHLSNRQLYELAQAWPQPPRLHHASPDKWRNKWGKTAKWDSRRWDRKWIRGEPIRREWVGGVYREHILGMKCGWTCGECAWDSRLNKDLDSIRCDAPHSESEALLPERGIICNSQWSALVDGAEERWKDSRWELVDDPPDQQLEWEMISEEGESDDETYILVE